MIEYQLKDKDGNTYDLNGDTATLSFKKSLSPGADAFSFDNRIVERSYLPGSALIGEKRLEQKGFTLTFDHAEEDPDNFRAELNSLLSFVAKTTKIVDVTNNMEIDVTAEIASIDYGSGSYKKMSDNSVDFVALSPFWVDLTADTESGTATADVIEEVAVTNSGFFDAYPVITLTATIATTDVQIYINSTNTGIQVQDSIFGTVGNLVMVIDCEKGLVSIGEDDRNASIVPGTGFFEIPIGSDTINILSSETIDYSIEWKKRYFI